ncbi:MAG: DUF3592 domain-containing protein [Pseudomonadota bacterium]
MHDLRVVGAVFAFSAGVVCLLWGLRQVMRAVKIRRSGGVSVGTVVSRRVHKEESLVTVRFLTSDNRQVQFEHLALPFQRNRCTVFYDISNPDKATISPRIDVVYGLILAGFGVLFVYPTHGVVLSLLAQ